MALFTNTLQSFIGISNPYDTMKLIKQISFDVKADVNYPNAYRPASNPGYHTRYDVTDQDFDPLKKTSTNARGFRAVAKPRSA